MHIYESIPRIAEQFGCVPDDVVIILVWGLVCMLVLYGFSVFFFMDIGVFLYCCFKRFVSFILTKVKKKKP